MKFKSFAVLAGALVCHSAFATLTLTGNFLQVNFGANGELVNGGTAGLKYNSAGTGGASGVDFNKWGAPVGDFTVTAGSDNYSVGNFSGGSTLGLSSFVFSDTSAGSLKQATMVRQLSNGLRHTRTVQFDVADKFFTVYDRYLNMSSTALSLAQVDAFDPDQGIPFGQGFGTTNDVDTSANEASASTYGLTMYTYSDDSRALASFIPNSLTTNNPFVGLYDPNGAFQDIGMSMSVDYGSVAMGQTVGSDFVVGFSGEPVPEPATMAALGLGLAALARRRRKN